MEKKKLMYVTLSIVLLLSICFAIPSVGNSKVFDVTSQEFTTAKPTTISSLEAANSIIKQRLSILLNVIYSLMWLLSKK